MSAQQFLNVGITNHREFLPANSGVQKLFVMLKLKPTKIASEVSPSTSFAFIIDTSGSMDEQVTSGKTKRDIVIDALQSLVQTQDLRPSDKIGIVQFNHKASILAELTPSHKHDTLNQTFCHTIFTFWNFKAKFS